MIEQLQPSDWQRLKKIRLAALQESPDAFASTLDEALKIEDAKWKDNKLMFKPNAETGALPFPREHITEHRRVRKL